MLRSTVVFAAVLAGGLWAGTAAAQSSAPSSMDADAEVPRYTLGLKLWLNNWETWNHPNEPERSDTKAAWIPVLGISVGRFFGSFSYFAKTRYHFPVNLGDVDRREMDLSLGYWVLQGDSGRLGLSLGYKDVRQKFGGADETIKAPFLGLTGAGHITGPWSFYMTGAYGPAQERFTGFSASGYYMSGEGGVAFAVARGMVATMGYKVQIIDVGGGGCNNFSGFATGAARCRDSTDGFILGLSQTF